MTFEKLVCIACGAPIDLPLEQGSVTCPYCSTRNYLKTDPRLLDLLTKMDGKLDQLHKPAAKPAPRATPSPKAPASLPPQNPPPSGNADFVEYIRLMVKSGKKIEAVKLVRERFNSGLLEAKNYVESLEG